VIGISKEMLRGNKTDDKMLGASAGSPLDSFFNRGWAANAPE